MNLVKELVLEKATTIDLRLVPTKKFFKPVLTIRAPLDQYNAELVGAQYLFTRFGAPREFEGAHKLHGELAGAEITFKGEFIGEFLVISQSVAHLSCQNKEKQGMLLSFRVHLTDEQDKLLALLDFLTKLNKQEFQVTVRAAQRSLIDTPADGAEGEEGEGQEAAAQDQNLTFPEPNEQGEYGNDQASLRPIVAKHGEAQVRVMEVEGGYICGWTVNWKHKLAGGEPLTTKRPVCASERMAIELGCREAFEFLKTIPPEGRGERESKNKIISALIDICPGLARESAREAAVSE